MRRASTAKRLVAAVAEGLPARRGDGVIPDEAAAGIRAASQVLNIEWIAEALDSPAERHLPAQRRLSAAAAGLRVRRGTSAAGSA